MGCTQIGNTQLICQSLVDSSTLNAESQQTQTSTINPETTTQIQAASSNNCRNSGFEDGQNGIFDVKQWGHCGGAEVYYNGFVSGCTFYDAFQTDYCKNFADGAIKLSAIN